MNVLNDSSPDFQPFAYAGGLYDNKTELVGFCVRDYEASVGRWTANDPIGFGGADPNFYAYVWNNPINYSDPLGLSGRITIHSSGNGTISGHSWIAYTPDGGNTTTYGTWGNDPTGQGNGLFENLESGMPSDASRTMDIDDSGENNLYNTISDYKSEGEDAWDYGAPCSEFAREAWLNATGENLNANWGPLSNPTTLKNSIIEANGGKAHNTAKKPCDTGSSASSNSSWRSSGSSSSSSGSSINSAGSSY